MPNQPVVMATGPTGFDRHFVVPTERTDSRIGVGLDTDRGDVAQFLVQLELVDHRGLSALTQIARIDHNPANPAGHDLRSEGIHVDVVLSDGTEVTMYPTEGRDLVPSELGRVVQAAVEYFGRHLDFFHRVHHGEVDPTDPPRWP